jgi:hypothetical protein
MRNNNNVRNGQSHRIDSLHYTIPVLYLVGTPVSYFPSMPLGLAGLRELIRRRRRPPPPAPAAAVRLFYSNFDWLD